MAGPTRYKKYVPRRRGLAFSCWRFTVLLVLSYGVWHTLQCPLNSGGQPRIGFSKSIAMEGGRNEIFPIDLHPSLESAPNNVDDPGDLYYFGRSIRNGLPAEGGSVTPSAPKTIRACSNRLRYILTEICHGNFHNPSTIKRSLSSWPGQREYNFAFRRVQRSVVNECCNKPCSIESLKKYCKDGAGSPIPSAQPTHVADPSPRIMEQSAEEVVEAEENQTESTPDPVVHEEEPAIFSILRFLNYVVNRPANNPRFRTGPSSGERALPIPQQRIQDRLDQEPGVWSITEGGPASGAALPPSPSGFRASHPSPVNFVRAVDEDVTTFPSRSEAGGHPHPHLHSHSAVEYGSEQGHVGRGSGRNAVTSTLPPFLIRVGPLTSDYI